MKKTLVALAVLAASGASFAQVTITGQYGYGYRAKTTGAVSTSGLGISDSNVVFGVTEDLGGGLKANAQMKLDGLSRAGVGGGDSFVALSGGFGTLTMGLAEYDTDLPDQFGTFLGATTASTGLVDSERQTDFIQYGTTFGPVGVSIRHTEPDKALATGSTGTSGASATLSPVASPAGQSLNTIAASYTAGPLVVKADYSAYNNKSDVGYFYDTRTTLGGNYDLGVVKFGLGFQRASWTQGVSATDTFVGLTAPIGALNLGVDYLSTKLDGTTTVADKTYSGWGVQAVYNLSKRTNVRFRYANFDGTLANTDKTSDTSVELYHNF